MKPIVLALVAVTLLAAITPVVLMASAQGPPDDVPRGPPDDVPQCTFAHPESLPANATARASEALDARSSHCPPAHFTQL
jgi:hypothetical protein